MRKVEQTRQEIIRKAAPIFNQRGYDGNALKATGLENGGIYGTSKVKSNSQRRPSTMPGGKL